MPGLNVHKACAQGYENATEEGQTAPQQIGPLESELRALTYGALFKKATEAGVDLGDADDKLTIVSLLMIGLAGECFFF